MVSLRLSFLINGEADDVQPVDTAKGRRFTVEINFSRRGDIAPDVEYELVPA